MDQVSVPNWHFWLHQCIFHRHTQSTTHALKYQLFHYLSEHSWVNNPLSTTLQITHLPQPPSGYPGNFCSFITEPYMTGSGASALRRSPAHIPLKSPVSGSPALLTCVSVLLVAPRRRRGLVLPQSPPPAASHPSWSLTINRKIQSAGHHRRLSSPLPARMSSSKEGN